MNIRIATFIPVLLLSPTLLWAQDAKTITMKKKPITMGQRWTVNTSSQVGIENSISSNGKLVEKVQVQTLDTNIYKAQALSTQGTKITRMAVEFGEISSKMDGSVGKSRQDSPVNNKQFTIQHLRKDYYVTDEKGERPSKNLTDLVFEKLRTELDPALNRHSFLGALPNRPLKIGETFALEENSFQKLLGSFYKIQNGKLTLTGSKTIDNVLCAVFKLSFDSKIKFANGVVFDIKGEGEVCAEIATSLHRSLNWEGKIAISGSGADAAGNPLDFQGSGKMILKHAVSYPLPKKVPAVVIGRTIPEAGQTWKESYRQTGNILRTVKQDGQIVLNELVKDVYTNDYKVTVIESSKNAITKVEVQFGKALKRKISPTKSEKLLPMSNGTFILEQKQASEDVKDCTITRKDNVAITKKLKEEIYDKVKELFKADRSELLELLPKGPIPSGKVITIDPKAALELYNNKDKDLKSASLKLIYRGTRSIGKRPTAVFQFSSRLHGEDSDGIHIYAETTGEFLFDIATGWPVGGKRNGQLKIEGSRANQIGDKIEIEGAGPISTRKRIDYVFKEKKRF